MPFPTLVNFAGASGSGGTTSFAPNLPASRVNGNTLWVYVWVNATGKTFTISAGWTPGDSSNTANVSAAWWWRIVDGTEVVPTITFVGAAAGIAQILQFAGPPAVPVAGPVHSAANGVASVPTAGLVTSVDNSWVINAMFITANQTLSVLWDRTALINNTAIAAGVTQVSYGPLNQAGTTSDAPSLPVVAGSNYVSFTFELLGTGVGAADQVITSQVVASAPETYSVPVLDNRVSQVTQSSLLTYVPPTLTAYVTQITVSALVPVVPPTQVVQIQIYD